MKHIKKSQPPQDFIEWKNKGNENWQPNWQNFQKPEKKETIKRLALGINKLKKMRAKAIEGLFDDFESLNDDEIRKLIDAFAKPNANGKHEEFCDVIVYVLKQYL